MVQKIFISYKRLDKDIVLPIVENIKERTGAECWIDMDGIESGDQFERTIIKAIKECDIVVFMMSKNSIAPYIDSHTGLPDPGQQSWTEREVKYARERKKRVIPLSIDGTKVSDCDWVEFNFNGTDCIDYNNVDQREKFFRNINKWLKNKADAEAKKKAEAEAKQRAEIEARIRAEAEAKRKAIENTIPAEPAKPSNLKHEPSDDSASKPKIPYKAIAAAAAVLAVLIAILAWPKGSSDKQPEPTAAVTDTLKQTRDTSENAAIAMTGNETTPKQSQAAQPSKSTAPKTATTPQATEETSTETAETIPTVEGVPSVLDSIGTCYLFGRSGYKKDASKAVSYYYSAALKGLAQAQSHLGSCYYNGVGVKTNRKQAFTWFRKAANQGDVTAQDNLGSCYLLGHGTTQDYKSAVEWYQKAADKGNASAQTHLGSCYYYGQGVAPDTTKAVFWYEKAAAQGNKTAARNLEKIRK